MKMQIVRNALLIVVIGLHLLGYAVQASEPKVSYLGSKSTFYDGDYSIYSVECRNGKKGKISFWENGKRWCIGVDKSECASNRRSIVQKVCR